MFGIFFGRVVYGRFTNRPYVRSIFGHGTPCPYPNLLSWLYVIRLYSDQLKLTKANYLEWLYQLKPGEKTEIPLSFTIEYPLGKEINIK